MDQPREIITDAKQLQCLFGREPLAVHQDEDSEIILYVYPEGIMGYYDRRSTRTTWVRW